MKVLLFLIVFFVGMGVGFWFSRRKPRKPKYLAMAEYWVYLPGTQIPEQDAVMTRMVANNPFSRRGQSPVGHAEGLLFSDIRLHIALALRTKNPNAFRPDLFESDLEVSETALQRLSEANSFVKIRYISEEPLKNRVHLQFLNHAAAAYAALGGGDLIYDVTEQRVFSLSEFEERLRTHFNVAGPEENSHVIWAREAGADRAETRGLRKVGLPELKTPPIDEDQKTLVRYLLQTAVERLWDSVEVPESLDLEAFGDQFRLLFEPDTSDSVRARILRMQS